MVTQTCKFGQHLGEKATTTSTRQLPPNEILEYMQQLQYRNLMELTDTKVSYLIIDQDSGVGTMTLEGSMEEMGPLVQEAARTTLLILKGPTLFWNLFLATRHRKIDNEITRKAQPDVNGQFNAQVEKDILVAQAEFKAWLDTKAA